MMLFEQLFYLIDASQGAFHHCLGSISGRRRGPYLLQAGRQSVRAGIVGPLNHTQGTSSIEYSGRNRVPIDRTGCDGGRCDLVRKVQRDILLGSHGLCIGGASDQGQTEGKQTMQTMGVRFQLNPSVDGDDG